MPDSPLKIDRNDSPQGTFLSLTGPLTLSNLFEFQALVRAEAGRNTVVEMAGVPYIDSAGIGCLVGAHLSHQKAGTRFVLASVNERILSTLRITHVDALFTMYGDADAARAALGKAAGA